MTMRKFELMKTILLEVIKTIEKTSGTQLEKSYIIAEMWELMEEILRMEQATLKLNDDHILLVSRIEALKKRYNEWDAQKGMSKYLGPGQ